MNNFGSMGVSGDVKFAGVQQFYQYLQELKVRELDAIEAGDVYKVRLYYLKEYQECYPYIDKYMKKDTTGYFVYKNTRIYFCDKTTNQIRQATEKEINRILHNHNEQLGDFELLNNLDEVDEVLDKMNPNPLTNIESSTNNKINNQAMQILGEKSKRLSILKAKAGLNLPIGNKFIPGSSALHDDGK